MASKMLEAGWSGPDKTWVVYNAVDCPHYAALPEPVKARRLLGLPQEARLLGLVARQVTEKGCFDAICLLQRLPARFHLLYAGDGPQHDALRRRVAELELLDRVHFIGFQDDMRTVYAAIDYLLFLSRTEPFGLVIAEAMAADVPVVGLTGEGGYMEEGCPLVTQDNAALIARTGADDGCVPVPAALIETLADRILELDADSAACRVMTERARTWVRDRFNATRQARDLSQVFRRVCYLRGPVPRDPVVSKRQ